MNGKNCIFCGTVCKNLLKHLEKYHKQAIQPFPKTEQQSKKFFRGRK